MFVISNLHKMTRKTLLSFVFLFLTIVSVAQKKEKIKGSKVLVLNALRKEKHLSHFTLQEALDIANMLEIPEVYFTHISHQLGLHDDISQELPSHVQLAYDGLEICL